MRTRLWRLMAAGEERAHGGNLIVRRAQIMVIRISRSLPPFLSGWIRESVSSCASTRHPGREGGSEPSVSQVPGRELRAQAQPGVRCARSRRAWGKAGTGGCRLSGARCRAARRSRGSSGRQPQAARSGVPVRSADPTPPVGAGAPPHPRREARAATCSSGCSVAAARCQAKRSGWSRSVPAIVRCAAARSANGTA
jgi:hypothetical protein